ncbi:hypothetical protein QW71_36050 [Paenibacillus sp. IHB B 3415]|nr:hypothetical protein QW71_36050 [Paenibacillus sp. IHB B 3415]
MPGERPAPAYRAELLRPRHRPPTPGVRQRQPAAGNKSAAGYARPAPHPRRTSSSNRVRQAPAPAAIPRCGSDRDQQGKYRAPPEEGTGRPVRRAAPEKPDVHPDGGNRSGSCSHYSYAALRR